MLSKLLKKYVHKSLRSLILFILVFLNLFLMTGAYAQSSVNGREVIAPTHNIPLVNTVVEEGREGENGQEAWGLTSAEWLRYQTLMKGRDGLWYAKLTPPAVLGLNANTSPELQYFARKVAREEHDKLARELAFNQAVYQAMRELYPNEPLITPFDLSFYNLVHSSNSVNSINSATLPIDNNQKQLLKPDLKQGLKQSWNTKVK